METKTKVAAADGQQDLTITRDFELPVQLLFRAYAEADLVEQWMGTKVLKLESRRHGSYEIETRTPTGEVAFRAHGVIHEFSEGRRIARTFEMEGAPFGVQLEVLEFEATTDATSRLRMHVIYETAAQRDQLLKMPFAFGLNMAHDHLQEVVEKLK
ncbi:MAG: SRPBCC domain-containing protein [Chthoniobacteraceae bacterium]